MKYGVTAVDTVYFKPFLPALQRAINRGITFLVSKLILTTYTNPRDL